MSSKDGKGIFTDNEQPDLVSYNCMLGTIASVRNQNNDSLAKAEFWMDKLLKTAQQRRRDKRMIPNHITYTALFKIISYSSIPNKAERALFWLEQSGDKTLLNNDFLLRKIEEMEKRNK